MIDSLSQPLPPASSQQEQSTSWGETKVESGSSCGSPEPTGSTLLTGESSRKPSEMEPTASASGLANGTVKPLPKLQIDPTGHQSELWKADNLLGSVVRNSTASAPLPPNART